MKKQIKYILQIFFGFEYYLLSFSVFKVFSLKYAKEEKSFFFFLNLLPLDSVVLDIGANVGYTSIILANYLKKGQVFSFEPIPIHTKIINRLVRIFRVRNIKLFEVALGDKIGVVDMIMPIEDSVKLQGLSHVVHDSIEFENDGERFEVEVKTLDYLENELTSYGRIDGIKIDIENFEYYALKGGLQLITKYKPIIYCELWENVNRTKTFELLYNVGYKGYILNDGNLVKAENKQHKSQNFFFIHQDNKVQINM